MAQLAVSTRNAQADALETDVGTSPILRVYNGSIPANCAAALSGNTLLAEGTLPSDWLTAASNGAKTKNGTWTLTGQSGAGSGTAATFYRLFASDGTTVKMQGPASATGGGGELTFNNNSIANGQAIDVASFSYTRGGA